MLTELIIGGKVPFKTENQRRELKKTVRGEIKKSIESGYDTNGYDNFYTKWLSGPSTK
jgi:hypothetical protein